jgi:methyl-accepting chemotaxis protein
MPSLNIFKQILASWFAGIPRRLPQESWSAPLGQVIESLKDLNRSTEQDFLTVGERLMEFRSAARQITSGMALLTELISGEQANNAGHALKRILDYSQAVNSGVTASGDCLGSLHGLAARVRRAFSGIPAMVSVLRNLCTLTRVETARLGNSSMAFGDLAADVIPLSESIQTSGAGVLESAARLDLGVDAALRTATLLRLKQTEELAPLTTAVTGSIRDFAARQQSVHDAAGRQSIQYGELCEGIDRLVGNIQFHDITRQQIEHVIQALAQINPSDPAQARAVLAVQGPQLRNSAQVFASAVTAIETNLEKIAHRLASMAENSGTLLGGSEDDHNSFFLRMEESFTTILQAMTACSEAQEEIETTPARMAGLIGEMTRAIDEIRVLESRIQRTAINASIRAVHIGATGAPLAVIAEEMERLVATSSSNTEDAAQALEAIARSADTLSGSGDLSRTSRDATEQMRTAILEMQSAAEISYTRVSEISSLGARLSDDIATLRSSFAGASAFSAAIDRACADLDAILAALPAGEASGAEELADLASRYTMQIERDIHQQITKGISVPEPADDSLGENVELW